VKRTPTTLLLAGLAVATAAGCGGQSDSRPVPAGGAAAATGPATGQVFLLHGTNRDQFEPETIEAKVGRLTLTLQNGGVPHDVTFKDSALPGIGVVSGSATKSTVLTFDRPGTYDFECSIHPGMVGKIVVTR
jgi:plastocyanin